MATTRARGKYWYARWREKDGSQREKGGFLTRKQAEIYGSEQERLVKLGQNTKPSELKTTLYDFVSEHWAKVLSVRPQTALDYELSLYKHIFPRFGSDYLNEITRLELRKWHKELKDSGLAERTVEKHLNLLASILKFAVEIEYLNKSPFLGWKRGKAQKKDKVQPLTYGQVEQIANGMPAKYRVMVWIGYYTGMRPAEILGLTWERINFQEKTIVIDRQISRDVNKVHEDYLKTSASQRTIGLSDNLAGLLKGHLAMYGPGPHGLVLSNRNGKVLRYHDASQMFRTRGRAVGLKPGQGMHQLRHTCASVLIQRKENSKAIQEMLGHASIQETMDTYGHLFPQAMAELSNALDSHASEYQEEFKLRLVD
jgi:integrase